jgi:biotin transport system substrate-specific component
MPARELQRRQELSETSGSLRLVLAALFAALVSAGALVALPLPPPLPPVVLTVFFILLAGLVLGAGGAGAAAALYLLLGSLGLPVFAGGTGGIGHFGTPTGGFLLAYLPAALVTGFLADRKGFSPLRNGLACLAGIATIYAIGLPWFQRALAAKFASLGAAALVMAPYFVGDLVKAAAATALAAALRPVLQQWLPAIGSAARASRASGAAPGSGAPASAAGDRQVP